MKIQEYVGKRLFKEYGLAVPRSFLVTSQDNLPEEPFYPCVLKSQVLVGGRMKAGGILFANNREEFDTNLAILLKKEIKGEIPVGILVEERMQINREHYISLLIDRKGRDIALVYSPDGGINIEDNHDSLVTGPFDQVIGQLPVEIQKPAQTLYKMMVERDLTLVEINPFGFTEDGEFIALDAVLHMDDNALSRQEWAQTEKEDKAGLPFHFVQLDGNIGIVGCGAGIVMATMDVVKFAGGEPANFLDLGGGAEEGVTLQALEHLTNMGIQKIVLNIFGGITKCDEIARALAKFNKTNPSTQLFVRLTGTNEDLGKQVLIENNINTYDDMYQMIKEAVA